MRLLKSDCACVFEQNVAQRLKSYLNNRAWQRKNVEMCIAEAKKKSLKIVKTVAPKGDGARKAHAVHKRRTKTNNDDELKEDRRFVLRRIESRDKESKKSHLEKKKKVHRKESHRESERETKKETKTGSTNKKKENEKNRFLKRQKRAI